MAARPDPRRDRTVQRRTPGDPSLDIARFPAVQRLLRSRAFPLGLVVAGQVVMWLVVAAGFLGAAVPGRNFATVFTWYFWFAVFLLLTVTVGRGWCLVCPFGGQAQWLQRLSFTGRGRRSLTLGWTWPARWGRWGLIVSAGLFILVTWAEEFFRAAAPGDPVFTAYFALFMIALALATFLLFERRTFCRYLCPLSAVVGVAGATGVVAGFRARNPDRCLTCATKACVRDAQDGHGCPWYVWPASAESNLLCGLCAECFKRCPYDNVGLFVQPPLTSVVEPSHRRLDAAWAVALLLGLAVFQQVNALSAYRRLDAWLNRTLHFPGYPNPLDYVGIIGLVAAVAGGGVWLTMRALRREGPPAEGGSFAQWFTPLMYGLSPLMASDILARQLPKLWGHVLSVLPAAANPFALHRGLWGASASPLWHLRLVAPGAVVPTQLVVVGAGLAASLYATARIVRGELDGMTDRPRLVHAVSTAAILGVGAAIALLYLAMRGTP